jgi:hypothetical protein
MLNKDGTSIYDHMNESHPISLPLDMELLARVIDSANYGSVRFLSAWVRVRKERHAERAALYRSRGDAKLADVIEKEGDILALAVEQLLRRGEF